MKKVYPEAVLRQMRDRVEAGAEPSRQEDNVERRLVQYLGDKAGRVESWLQSHLNFVAVIIVVLGFLIRVVDASKTYLNPDEALHYVLINQPSLAMVYKASLTSAHPPLIFFLLYFWRFLGSSELTLRLLSVLAGTAFLWVAFEWMGDVFGRGAGLVGLLLLTFSPTMILLSAQVRGYALLFLCMASALYVLERAFEEKSAGRMLLFSLFLYLALLTHYSALWFTLAVGVYALLRILRGQLPAKVVGFWVGSQVGVLALLTLLYLTHISKRAELKGALDYWLRFYLFQPGKDHLLPFVMRKTAEVFGYVFAHDEVGVTMLLFFLLGIGLLLARRAVPERSRTNSRALAVLLVLPFVVVCAAAIAGIYPYGARRELTFLALFAIPGASLPLARLGGKQLWPGLLAAIVVLTFCNLDAIPVDYLRSENQTKALMGRALDDIHQSIPRGALIFVEYETNVMLRYYLCRDQIFPIDDLQRHFLEFHCGGYQLVSTGALLEWVWPPETFASELDQMAKLYGLRPGERVWVVHAGWNFSGKFNFPSQLAMQFPELGRFPHHDFGENLSVLQVPVGLAAPSQARTGSP